MKNISLSILLFLSGSSVSAQEKLVMQDKLSAEQTPIQMSQLAPGEYSLTLSNTIQNIITFKLVKTH